MSFNYDNSCLPIYSIVFVINSSRCHLSSMQHGEERTFCEVKDEEDGDKWSTSSGLLLLPCPRAIGMRWLGNWRSQSQGKYTTKSLLQILDFLVVSGIKG